MIRKVKVIIISRIDILALLPGIHCESIFLVIDVSIYFWNFKCVLHVLHLFHNGLHTCIHFPQKYCIYFISIFPVLITLLIFDWYRLTRNRRDANYINVFMSFLRKWSNKKDYAFFRFKIFLSLSLFHHIFETYIISRY